MCSVKLDKSFLRYLLQISEIGPKKWADWTLKDDIDIFARKVCFLVFVTNIQIKNTYQIKFQNTLFFTIVPL